MQLVNNQLVEGCAFINILIFRSEAIITTKIPLKETLTFFSWCKIKKTLHT